MTVDEILYYTKARGFKAKVFKRKVGVWRWRKRREYIYFDDAQYQTKSKLDAIFNNVKFDKDPKKIFMSMPSKAWIDSLTLPAKQNE